MKKQLVIIISSFIFICSQASSQNLKKLDQLNGYDKLKFGTEVKAFKNITRSITQENFKDVVHYVYTGNDITELAGVKIDHINLAFYKDKLYLIMICFGSAIKEYTKSEYDSIQKKLESYYGRDFSKLNAADDPAILNSNVWAGNMVILESSRLDMSKRGSSNSDSNQIGGYVVFSLKNIEKEKEIHKE